MSHKTIFLCAVPLLTFSLNLFCAPVARTFAQTPDPTTACDETQVAENPCNPACQIIYESVSQNTPCLRNGIVYEKREITTLEPVWETEMRMCYYTVARPETQIVEREQRCVVIKPIWETSVCDQSYEVVRNVVETAEREERYTICRPVYETEQREQKVLVNKYVTRTVEQDVQRVSLEPVTKMRTTHVDRGQYVTETYQKPGMTFSMLRWAPGGWGPDPANGRQRYELPGLVWKQNSPRMRTLTRSRWQPRTEAVEVPETTYQRVVTNVKVPIQVGEWVSEEEVRQVCVCVCKMVTEECVRTVPYTTCRQVIEKVENRVTIPVCKYIREERVRKIPCTYSRLVYEQRVQQVPVRVCKMVPVRKTILVPRYLQTLVPNKTKRLIPRTVVLQVPGLRNAKQLAEKGGDSKAPSVKSASPAESKRSLSDGFPRPVLPSANRIARQWGQKDWLS